MFFVFLNFGKKKIFAQIDEIDVPSKIKFADLILYIDRDAKKMIKEKIDSLIRHEKSFKILLERVILYMPIIDRILEEEGVPSDFRYIPIQESGMISDAKDPYSIGFWQFKDYTAKEVSLVVNEDIDERCHIVESTRGAAKYLKKNNNYCKNWLVSLLAYNRGRGWVEKNGFNEFRDKKEMKIDKNAHFYVIHFLAHKIVFEKYLKNSKHSNKYIHEAKGLHGESMSDIAKKYDVDEKELTTYNKWMKNLKHIPINKTVIIPMSLDKKINNKELENEDNLPKFENFEKKIEKFKTSDVVEINKKKEICHKNKIDYKKYMIDQSYPFFESKNFSKKSRIKIINGIKGVISEKSDTIESLSKLGDVSISDFIKFNDLEGRGEIIEGIPYYFEFKNKKTKQYFHISKKNENWWKVSQKYGITFSSLLKNNRENNSKTKLEEGRVLWLRSIRPKRFDVEFLKK